MAPDWVRVMRRSVAAGQEQEPAAQGQEAAGQA